jgi:hypothetical protein
MLCNVRVNHGYSPIPDRPLLLNLDQAAWITTNDYANAGGIYVSDFFHRLICFTAQRSAEVDVAQVNTQLRWYYSSQAGATYDSSILHTVHTGSGAKSVSYTTGTEALSLGVECQERETGSSPLSTIDYKNGGATPQFPHRSA